MINKRRIYKLLIKGSVMASFHPPLMLQSEHKKINQLPLLGGRWVPGKPRGSPQSHSRPWAPIPGTRHTDETLEGRKIRDGGKGKMLKKPLHRLLHNCSKKNSQILAVYVESYHVPCKPALMGLTAGCPLSLWTAWPLSSWTAWPLSSRTAWPLISWWLTYLNYFN